MGTAAKVALGVFLGVALLLASAVGALFAFGVLPPRLSKVEYEDRMQSILANANAETGRQLEDFDPSKSVENAVRGFRAQASTLDQTVEEFEELNPPREIDEKHERLIAAYGRAGEVVERGASDTDWAASDSGQQALNTALDAAAAAEDRIRSEGYDIGTPYF